MSSRLRGFHLAATDGEVGHVDDFFFDDATWAVRYLAVDTSNWIGGRSVLVSPTTIQKIDTGNRIIRVALTREQIKNGPSVEAAKVGGVETLPTVWILE